MLGFELGRRYVSECLVDRHNDAGHTDTRISPNTARFRRM